jgi:hypothetical protein
LKQYATGQSLLEAGAISGHDMTVECAAIKLGYLMVYSFFFIYKKPSLKKPQSNFFVFCFLFFVFFVFCFLFFVFCFLFFRVGIGITQRASSGADG